MPKKWAYIIIMTVATLVIWSGWEIYKAFRTEKDVGQYNLYAQSISRDFDVDLIKKIGILQEKVIVKSSEIAPKGETTE
jgi:hypothetical protein